MATDQRRWTPIGVLAGFLLILVILPAGTLPGDSEATLLQELQIVKQEKGASHQAVAVCLGRLGAHYLREGRIEKAVAVLRQALVIRQAGLGARHLDTLEAERQLIKVVSRLPVQP